MPKRRRLEPKRHAIVLEPHERRIVAMMQRMSTCCVFVCGVYACVCVSVCVSVCVRGDQLARGSERPGEMVSCCMPAQACHCVALFLDPAQRP